MTPQTIEKMKRYEVLKLQIKELENELDMLKPDIISEIPEETEVKTEKGVFILQKRRVWKYSPATVEEEAALKAAKKREEADGTAVETFGAPFLVYREA